MEAALVEALTKNDVNTRISHILSKGDNRISTMFNNCSKSDNKVVATHVYFYSKDDDKQTSATSIVQ